MRKHQREVADYLRDEYGADGVRIETGGKHPKLVFNYQDREHRVPLGNPSDFRAMKNLHSELRKKLGEPSNAAERQPRKLEDMMAELNTTTAITTLEAQSPQPAMQEREQTSSPAKTWAVKMACYANGHQTKSHTVWFIFPKDIIKAFPGPMKIEKLDEEHWKISPGGMYPFTEYSSQAKMTYSDYAIPKFGTTAAEAIEESGEILVFLSKDKRNGVKALTQFVVPEDRGPKLPREGMPLAPEPTPPPAPTPVSPPPSGVAMEVRMRSIINGAREIEALCPYRLTRMPDGRLVWQAPVIE